MKKPEEKKKIRHVLCQRNVLPYPLQVGGQVNDKMFLISTDARGEERFKVAAGRGLNVDSRGIKYREVDRGSGVCGRRHTIVILKLPLISTAP